MARAVDEGVGRANVAVGKLSDSRVVTPWAEFVLSAVAVPVALEPELDGVPVAGVSLVP